MPSLESKITEAITEVRGLTKALNDEVTERRRDHDVLTTLKTKFDEQMRTVTKSIEDIEKARVEEAKAKIEEDKEADSRGWQTWQMVLGWVGSAIAAGLVTWAITKMGS